MIEIAKEAALAAGSFLRERFSQRLVADWESHNDVKLPEDRESERRIIEVIHRELPDHTIVSEEIGMVQRSDDYVWIVDPLDGTNNYWIGNPYFSVSIALEHRGEIVLGVVYNPVADQLFWAEKGNGAFLNGTRMHVNDRSELEKAIGTYIRGRETVSKEQEWAFTQPFFFHTKRLMRNIAPALDFCLLANGWLDYIVMQRSGFMDVAAGVLIAQEAGAKVTDWQGRLFQPDPYHLGYRTSMLASNGLLHDSLMDLIRHDL